MKDVREIPGLLFQEFTAGRQPEAQSYGTQVCDMDHGLRMVLDPHEAAPSITTLGIVHSQDPDRRIATLSAGRTWGQIAYTQTVSLIQQYEAVNFSDPKGSETMIYGLELTRDIARRAFIILTLDDYDTSSYTPEELGLNFD